MAERDGRKAGLSPAPARPRSPETEQGIAGYPLVLAELALAFAALGLVFEDWSELASILPLSLLLYSKLGREKVLDNFIRGKIFGYIVANPGENCNFIMLKLGISHGTFHYHLKRLEDEGLIRSQPDGLVRRCYPAHMAVPDAVPQMLTAAERSVYDMIQERPGISQSEIAGRLTVSDVAVNYHARALLQKGVVRRERKGLRFRYFAQEGGEATAAADAAGARSEAV